MQLLIHNLILFISARFIPLIMDKSENIDYFGYTLWTDLFMGHPDWLSSLNLGKTEDFDPEEDDVWGKLFGGLKQVLQESGLDKNMGAVFHVSSQIAEMTLNEEIFEIAPSYWKAREEFEQEIPLDIGLHCQFNDKVNPLGEDYHAAFLKDLDLAQKFKASTMVAHPPKNFSYDRKEFMDLFLDDVLSDELVDALAKTSIIISWENMIAGQFSSLKSLVEFREALGERLSDMGEKDLIKQHRFCLDTGHLLMWKANHPSQALAQAVIDEYLPKFSENLNVFHIHANDGSSDSHITPFSTEFMDHKTRSGINPELFQTCSNTVVGWLNICNAGKKLSGRHIHLETDNVPFRLEQTIEFGKRYSKL